MAAKTVMHDELTGVTITIEDDETTELMTVIVNGHEVLIPEEQHSSLYAVASKLQGMMRDIKDEVVEMGITLEEYDLETHTSFPDTADGLEPTEVEDEE